MIDGGVPNTAEKTVFPTLPTAVLLHIAVIAATPALIVAVVERVAAAVGAGVGAGVIGDGVGGQSVQPLHAKNASHFSDHDQVRYNLPPSSHQSSQPPLTQVEHV